MGGGGGGAMAINGKGGSQVVKYFCIMFCHQNYLLTSLSFKNERKYQKNERKKGKKKHQI